MGILQWESISPKGYGPAGALRCSRNPGRDGYVPANGVVASGPTGASAEPGAWRPSDPSAPSANSSHGPCWVTWIWGTGSAVAS